MPEKSFIPFLAYFMLTWQDHTKAATVMLFRMENRNTAYVTLGRISKMIRSFMVGNLVIGVILSVLSMIAFSLIHREAAERNSPLVMGGGSASRGHSGLGGRCRADPRSPC